MERPKTRWDLGYHADLFAGLTTLGCVTIFESRGTGLSDRPDRVESLALEVRAGVHTGEVRTIDGSVGGMGVVIGARVGALAGASEAFVSQTVKDFVAGSGLSFEDAGEHELDGVPDRWHLHRVVGS